MYYILEGRKAVPCKDVLKWAKLFEEGDRCVAVDEHNDVRVSTVFIGIDHNWGSEPPLLFETMVFGGEYNQEMERYATWEEAETGHARMCMKVFQE